MSTSDGASPFGDLLDEAWQPDRDPERHGRAGRRVLATVLVFLLVVLLGSGGYVWWAAAAPLGAPTVSSSTPSVAPGPAVALALPSDGASRVSVQGAEAYLGAAAADSLASSGGDDPRPIASITKIITALVILDRHPLSSADDPGPSILFDKSDSDLYDAYYVRGATIAPMPAGTTLSLHDALTTMLLPSASNYADALSRWAFGSTGAFVSAARGWLAARGLNGTTIVDPTGLDARNTSTPTDLVALGKLAAADPTVSAIAATPHATFSGPGTVVNTNDLLGTDGVTGLKTGNLGQGTFNLLFTADLDAGLDTPLKVTGVTLGGDSHDSTDQAVAALLESIRAGFHRIPVGAVGDEIGTITTPWGSNATIVLAKNAQLLTWSDTPIAVTLDTRTPERYADGEVVGTITWTAGPSTTTADVKISGAIDPPTLLWRLTHPTELGG